jgi:glycosyltransferase involved in cell wall biosynthesis
VIAFKNFFSSQESQGRTSSSSIGAKGKAGEQNGWDTKTAKWLNTFFFITGASVYFFYNRKSIDIIHTHVASWNAGFAGWIGHKLNIKVLCKAAFLPAFHDFGTAIPFASVWNEWRKRIAFIALLPEMADDICKQGVAKEQIHTLSNGVCIPQDSATVEKNNSVLYVGNFSQGSDHKGFDILIKAWNIIHKHLPGIRLFIAGSGEKRPWKQMAFDLGCNESISFLGHVPDLSKYYKEAGIFVLPSRGEGISNALLEAQSYGIPAVVSDIPGNSKVVANKKTGYLVPVNDAVGFADAIIKLLGNSALRKKMGREARNNIVLNYSITSIVERLKTVYEDIGVP